MPEGVTGPDLLVNLMTERVIDKLMLKENWEVPGGWEHEDLRAIVACALGDSYANDQDRRRAVVVEKRTLKSLMKNIRQHGNPPIYHEDNTGHTPTPEAYYTVLILGMFDETNPLNPGKRDEGGTMGEEFAGLLEVPKNKIKERPFEHPKRVVMERYQKHLERKQKREAFRSWQALQIRSDETTRGLTDEQVFQVVLGHIAQQGIPGMVLTPARRRELDGTLLRLGILPPSLK